MPIDENFNLDSPDGITDEHIREMEKIANELEQLAKDAEQAMDKIQEGERKSKQKQRIPFGSVETYDDYSIEPKTGERSPVNPTNAEMFELFKSVLELSRRQTGNEEKVRTLEMKVNSAMSTFANTERDILSFWSNPSNFMMGKGMRILTKAGIAGAIVSFAINLAQDMYSTIMKEIHELFAYGGRYDVRKLVLDEIKTIPSLATVLQINSGEIYFTSDSSEQLRQGVNKNINTNTRRLVHGHIEHLNQEKNIP